MSKSLIWAWTKSSRAHLVEDVRCVRAECGAPMFKPIDGTLIGSSKAMHARIDSERGFCCACLRIEIKRGAP